MLVFADAQQGAVEPWYPLVVGQKPGNEAGISFGLPGGRLLAPDAVDVFGWYSYGGENR